MLNDARDKVLDELLSQRTDAGHWIGELSASALSTATAISALSFVLRDQRVSEILEVDQIESANAQIATGIAWLSRQQNDDGGFGDTDLNYSNISTTMLVVAALKAADVEDSHSDLVARARTYIAEQGGIDGLRKRYGKDKTFAVPILANCAMAGDVPWKEVSILPFEAATVPQSMYRLMQMPVVSYAIPALVSIGQAKYFHDPPWNPLARIARKLAVNRTLRVLEKMQPASGGYLEAVPLTSFVVMGLATTGRANHPVVKNGVRFLLDSFREEESWPIDTNLATWNTTLAINAISRGATEVAVADSSSHELLNQFSSGKPLDWLLSCQNTDVHPFTGANPGGWGWTDLSGAVPDADDTPGALIALKNILEFGSPNEIDRGRIQVAAAAGVSWLLSLQNRDHGWPTFCRGWGKLPFDRSGADITAHVIRALKVWQDELSNSSKYSSAIRIAIDRGVKYLGKQQRDDGSWLPLWFGNQDNPDDENPVYGTAKVLLAYHELGLSETPAAKRGYIWLRTQQNEDGGWGGGKSRLTVSNDHVSSVEETALAVETLALKSDSTDLTDPASPVNNGANWLAKAVAENRFAQVSPIGFYFAKLWYHERLYPLIFTLAALNAVTSRVHESGS